MSSWSSWSTSRVGRPKTKLKSRPRSERPDSWTNSPKPNKRSFENWTGETPFRTSSSGTSSQKRPKALAQRGYKRKPRSFSRPMLVSSGTAGPNLCQLEWETREWQTTPASVRWSISMGERFKGDCGRGRGCGPRDKTWTAVKGKEGNDKQGCEKEEMQKTWTFSWNQKNETKKEKSGSSAGVSSSQYLLI